MTVSDNNKKRIKQIIAFIVAAALVQIILLTVAQPFGVSLFYPLAVSLYSQKVTTDNNSFIEYYRIRERLMSKNLFIIGADTGVSGTYNLLMDILKYVKLNVNITKLFLEISTSEADQLNGCINSVSADEYAAKKAAFSAVYTAPDAFFTFVDNLYDINTHLPPKNKLTVVGISGGSNVESAINYLSDVFAGRYDEFPPEYKGLIKSGNLEDFATSFNETGETYIDALGESVYYTVKAVCNEYVYASEHGAMTDVAVASRITSAVLDEADSEAGYFALLDTSRTEYDSEFMKAIENGVSKIVDTVTVDFRYDNCTYLNNEGNIVIRSDIDLPSFNNNTMTYRLVDTRSLSGYFAYSSLVNRGRGSINDPKNFASEIYFIISNCNNLPETETEDTE